jgi:hypothetical protein
VRCSRIALASYSVFRQIRHRVTIADMRFCRFDSGGRRRDPGSVETKDIISRHTECTVICSGKAEAVKDERLGTNPRPRSATFPKDRPRQVVEWEDQSELLP